ncbi:hypothetical protein GEV33_002874 [Tenebrio molitor]|uniref:Uncharacterized protein n=1 Tax=Tenebrio molitor TaxID=7067 RepID=A0A8J6HSM1_TENMO|nr:hypothetical protein GEV33_002874 [Tenebrio molitor]
MITGRFNKLNKSLNIGSGPAEAQRETPFQQGAPLTRRCRPDADGGMSYGQTRHPTLHLQIIPANHCPLGHFIFRHIVSTSLMPVNCPANVLITHHLLTPDFIGLFMVAKRPSTTPKTRTLKKFISEKASERTGVAFVEESYKGYSGTLTPGEPMPCGTSMGYPVPGGVFCGLMEVPWAISPERCGSAVMNSAIDGWLLMNPVSLHPSMGNPGWGAPEAAETADNQKPPPPPPAALSGLLDLVLTTTKSSSSKCPVGIRSGCLTLIDHRRAFRRLHS